MSRSQPSPESALPSHAIPHEADDPTAWLVKGTALVGRGRRAEGVHWLYRAWLERARLPDGGQSVAELLTDLGVVLDDCEECTKRGDD